MDGSSAIDYPLLAREVNYHLLSSFGLQLWDMVITSAERDGAYMAETLELIFQVVVLVPPIPWSCNANFQTTAVEIILAVRGRHYSAFNYMYASSIAVVTTQSTLLGLALMKHILARRAGWGRAPLVSLLIRDGTGHVFHNMCDLLLYRWLISIMSSCGCRLIVNMQCLAVDEKFVPPPITSEIEVEFPSDLSSQSIAVILALQIPQLLAYT
ncbi:hypothetical protein EV702DRAFT_1047494 [Suillus placidus]|uniref:Uncharacterized protein n=1 Tax=Suillus placidus TaxID=48579 RepID=A0A9P6ZQ78_9AGAM|nr:hypothetical protein EV702DRAFT_1047494 [Suillus placidus]